MQHYELLIIVYESINVHVQQKALYIGYARNNLCKIYMIYI